MKTVQVTAYPFATQYGRIDVPEDVDERSYVKEHWGEIEFDEPELDYSGTEFEVWG